MTDDPAAERPHLDFASAAVRDSYLVGEREVCLDAGEPIDWMADAAADFDAYVRGRLGVRRLWGVPVTELWFVAGTEYFGTVVVRHELTPELAEVGGHIGYHVVPARRRRGHGTRMLAEALVFCWGMGLGTVLVTCAEGNVGSRRVIEANGGELLGAGAGHLRYRFDRPPEPASPEELFARW